MSGTRSRQRHAPTKHRRFLAAIAIAASISVSLALQTPPDFSGQWAADPEPAMTPPGPSAPPAPGDLGSGWGSPITITQDATQLVVEHARFSLYDLQPPLRFVFALEGSETRNVVMMGHATQVRLSGAAWEGQTLRVTTIYPSTDPSC
jgi:hypothetical protein